jgi:exopolysaccharide biosynthesis protein
MKILKFSKFWLSLFIFFLIVSYNYLPTLAQHSFFNSSSLSLISQQPTSEKIVQTGKEVFINNQVYILPWIQWKEDNNWHFGLSDTRAEGILGIELLSTNQPNIQPVHWFASYQNLPTKFINPYRYLDITEFAELNQINLNIEGDRLKIDLSPTQVKKVSETPELAGKKIIVELEKPAFWQFSQGSKQGVLKIQGQAVPALIEQFKPPHQNNSAIEEEEGDTPTGGENKSESQPLFTIENKNNQTVITINVEPSNKLRVNSSNPNLLFIDIKPNAVIEREITWNSDIFWQQKYISLPAESKSQQRDSFFVSYLTVNPKNFDLKLRPITTNNNTAIGTAPLTTTARNSDAIIAINGGFFNRNNQLPLGAIKAQEKWLSGPILNRGVIAWDEVGNTKIGRLKLQETLTTFDSNQEMALGDRFVINYLNSGYVQPGISRYTPEWGSNYVTLSDNEIIIIVENEEVKEQIICQKAGEDSISIPRNGYILTLRKSENLATKLAKNTKLELDSFTIPAEFNNYPYIVGAGPVLLLDRQIVLNGEAENFSKAFNQQKASRSAIATTTDGKILLVGVHHRIGGPGPSLSELAQILQNLGAVDALNLDGGSSTQIYLGGQIIDRSPETAAKVHNGIGVFLN